MRSIDPVKSAAARSDRSYDVFAVFGSAARKGFGEGPPLEDSVFVVLSFVHVVDEETLYNFLRGHQLLFLDNCSAPIRHVTQSFPQSPK